MSENSGLVNSWADITPPKTGGGNKLVIKSNESKTMRLFHRPLPIWRYFNPVTKKSAICADPEKCPIVLKGYKGPDGKPLKPKLRYVINVIDRSDNQVKTYEAPRSVFMEFKKCYETAGVDPGGKEAPDFTISVSGSGINTKYDIKYKVMDKKPFTSEEIELLKAHKVDLAKEFAATPADKIEQVLGLVSESAAAGDSGSTTATAGGDEIEWA